MGICLEEEDANEEVSHALCTRDWQAAAGGASQKVKEFRVQSRRKHAVWGEGEGDRKGKRKEVRLFLSNSVKQAGSMVLPDESLEHLPDGRGFIMGY